MSQVKCEVRSEFEVRCIQLEQKIERQAKDFEDKLQINKTETLLMLDNKKDQLEHVVEKKIENTKIQWSDHGQ